jgi:hypothetical protein
MLMPAAVLIVLVLASLSVDLSLVHLGRREVLAAAEAAANDAVTAGVSEEAYRAGRGYELDARRVEGVVRASLRARGLDGQLAAPPTIDIAGTTVSVRLVMRVDYVFARALPGAKDHTEVAATGSAAPVMR